MNWQTDQEWRYEEHDRSTADYHIQSYSDESWYEDLDLVCVSDTAVIILTCQFTEYF